MNQPLEKKLALVTGASRGIGAAIAQRLAEYGAAVLVHYSSNRTRAEGIVNQIKQAGQQAEAVSADLSTSDGPQVLLGKIDTAFGGQFDGRVDVLVNNAGTAEFSSLMDATDEAFDNSLTSMFAPSFSSRVKLPGE